ncbi:MAG TPA: DUF790 family protein [Chloroflexia bacterium]|nr:DUF790 family protein [Chloroflexia bacterium]
MLKLAHVQARLNITKGQASVNQMNAADPVDNQRALDVIAIFQEGVVSRLTREKLYEKLAAYSGSRLDYREIDGLAKVICDSFCTFEAEHLPLSSAWTIANPAAKGEVVEVLEDLEPAEENERANEGEADSGRAATTTLGTFRLALWREAARPEFSPFHKAGLTVALKPGLKSLRRAATFHDENLLANLLPEEQRRALVQRTAEICGYELEKTAPVEPGKLGNWLFGDVPERHRLVSLSPELNVENLLNRYNVELLRGVLYLAPRVRIVVRDKYKDLFKYIKLFRLMHEVKPLPLQTPDLPGVGSSVEAGGTSHDGNGEEEGKDGEADRLAEKEIGGYEIILEGASSPFLARTDRRYGIQFARFLPALLLCEAEWQLEAELVFPIAAGQSVSQEGKQRQERRNSVFRASYKLGPQPHLRTHFKGSGEFDSLLEENLAAAFEQRFQATSRVQKPQQPLESIDSNPGMVQQAEVEVEEGGRGGKDQVEAETGSAKVRRKSKHKKVEGERQGWVIKREDRIIPVFDTVMIPDFAFQHRDGRRALLEIVGFWERSYLERKIAKLNRAGRRDLIVLVSERTRVGREHFLVEGKEPPYQLIFFKGKPQLGPILAALEKCAVPARVD